MLLRKKISSNMEDYLEAISGLIETDGVARVKDISSLLSVKAPSVSSALDNLTKRGLVIHKRYGYVELTAEGASIAKDVAKRHTVLLDFLTTVLNINVNKAKRDACKIEHAMSKETFEKLTKFMEFVEKPDINEKSRWFKKLESYVKSGK